MHMQVHVPGWGMGFPDRMIKKYTKSIKKEPGRYNEVQSLVYVILVMRSYQKTGTMEQFRKTSQKSLQNSLKGIQKQVIKQNSSARWKCDR